MDPLSQGALGAAAALAIWGRDQRLKPRVVGWLGALAAMAPDLDVLIRSESDPLLAIEYHRHFTHSLAFVPIGATLALLPWLLLPSIRRHLKLAWLIAALGYLTHAPLDCCTTYGTQYFWPLSDFRVSLSWVSVVDPVYTLPLLALVLLAAFKKRPVYARAALVLSCSYLGLGALQKARATTLQSALIEKRGHHIGDGISEPVTRRAVFTTFMNQVTWRSLYERRGRIYIDQLRVPYVGQPCTKAGANVEPAPGPPAQSGPRVERAHRLMRWFSSDWVAYSSADPTLLGDLRYSLDPWGSEPFWAIRDDVVRDRVEWVNTRSERKASFDKVRALIFQNPEDSDCSY